MVKEQLQKLVGEYLVVVQLVGVQLVWVQLVGE